MKPKHPRGLPRGLIEAIQIVSGSAARAIAASAGSTPAASLKQQPHAVSQPEARISIRGVYPRGLIEARRMPLAVVSSSGRIRGVYPRGLIEAPSCSSSSRYGVGASAGSTPAASLKLRTSRRNGSDYRPRIRGVYPRGLIEATLLLSWFRRPAIGIRGVYPRGLIEAPNQ